jgi:hypothetical protein
LNENSNHCWESLLEVIGQNIAGHCQQTFENKKFVDTTQQCFAFTPKTNFPANNLNFHFQSEDDEIEPRLSSKIFTDNDKIYFFYFITPKDSFFSESVNCLSNLQ